MTLTLVADVSALNRGQRQQIDLYLFTDTDGDGIEDSHVAVDDDTVFDTVLAPGRTDAPTYTVEDMTGCSCEQIIEAMELGRGHTRFGCSNGVMTEWVAATSGASSTAIPLKAPGGARGNPTTGVQRRLFSDEFKREAVRLASERGRRLVDVARELEVRPRMIRRWRREFSDAAADSGMVAERKVIRRQRRSLMRAERDIHRIPRSPGGSF